MVRTQIYLTENEKQALMGFAVAAGKNQSEIIREAIDQYIIKNGEKQRKKAFKDAAGMWKDRKDLPDFDALRKEWDRH